MRSSLQGNKIWANEFSTKGEFFLEFLFILTQSHGAELARRRAMPAGRETQMASSVTAQVLVMAALVKAESGKQSAV